MAKFIWKLKAWSVEFGTFLRVSETLGDFGTFLYNQVDVIRSLYTVTKALYRVTIKEIDTFNVVLKRNY